MNVKIRTVFWAALAMSAVGANAKADPSAAKIAAAKQSMIEGADEAFVEFWTATRKKAALANVSAEQVRRLSKLGFVGYSFGLCSDFTAPSDDADWAVSIDRYISTLAGIDADGTEYIRAIGDKWVADGKRGGVDFDAAALKRYCAVELPAARQLLGEI